MASDEIAFSRVNRTGDELTELRVNSPKYVLAVVDAVSIAETRASGKVVSRTDIVNRILSKFAEHEIDRASLVKGAINSNPTVLEENDD